MDKEKFSSRVDKIFEYSKYIVGFGVLLYVIGFLIENVYLNSFGITIFDILKVRYILIGILFLVFTFSVIIPTYDVILYYLNVEKFSIFYLFGRIIQNGFILYITLVFTGFAITILSGPKVILPIGMGDKNSPLPISTWIDQALPYLLKKSCDDYSKPLIYFIFFITIIILFFFIYFMINPNIENKKVTRKEVVNIFNPFKKEILLKIVNFLVVLLFIAIIFPAMLSLISFLITNTVIIPDNSSSFSYVDPYDRFIISSIISYIGLTTTILLLIMLGKRITDELPRSKGVVPNFTGFIYLLTIIVIFLIPIYIYGVYPLMPQQIGGGKAIPIEIVISDINLQSKFDRPLCDLYMVDRTSSSIILLCANTVENDHKVYEILMDNVKSIIFLNE